MRFIGNKTKLVEYIYETLGGTSAVGEFRGSGLKFYDFFAGTGSVGKFYKAKGAYVEASDILYFSSVIQRAAIENTGVPAFENLLPKLYDDAAKNVIAEDAYGVVLAYLNSIKGVEGYIYKNYTDDGTVKSGSEYVRKFFSPENGKKIDAVRITIEAWKAKGWIGESEYYVLLATLIESVPYFANISGVYAAFLKHYDPRALKKFELRRLALSRDGKQGRVYCGNSMDRLSDIDTDILYLDPPYNARQYAPNYHLLETIALYDEPLIKGVAGIRDYAHQKSVFCNAKTAITGLDQIAGTAKYKVLALSYNDEGIMKKDEIIATLRKYGKVKVHNLNYRRFKSNNNGLAKNKTHVQEQLFVLER